MVGRMAHNRVGGKLISHNIKKQSGVDKATRKG